MNKNTSMRGDSQIHTKKNRRGDSDNKSAFISLGASLWKGLCCSEKQYDGIFPSLQWLIITKSVLFNSAIIQVLPFLNNHKDLDPSYKMDLDLWDYFGR